jgi:hypothetical protein
MFAINHQQIITLKSLDTCYLLLLFLNSYSTYCLILQNKYMQCEFKITKNKLPHNPFN